MLGELEKDIRCILNYTNCGADDLVYRDSCALRYDALVKLSNTKSDEIKRNSYLNEISKMIDTCQKKDIESIITEFAKSDLNGEEEFDVNVKCKLGLNDPDISTYEKILEFAIQGRLKTVDSDRILLDSIIIEQSEDGKNIASVDFKLNKNIKEKVA